MISPVYISVLWFICLLTVMSTIGSLLVVKLVPRESRIAMRSITQPTLTVVGMMFSILVGFFIAQALKDYTEAQGTIQNEANAVAEVFRDARGLGETDRKRIRGL